MIYDYKTLREAPKEDYICQRSRAGNVVWVLGPEDQREGMCCAREVICTCGNEKKATTVCDLLNLKYIPYTTPGFGVLYGGPAHDLG